MGILMGKINRITLPLVTIVMLVSQSVLAGPAERNQAKRIHDRLTGVNATNAAIDDMERTLDCTLPALPGYPCDPSGKNAALYAIDTAVNPNARYFYNVTLKNFATPWTNEEQTVFTPLNDYTATVIGLIRDSGDFRQILHGDIIYRGANSLGISGYSNSDNDHYEELEALGPITGNLADPTILEGTISTPAITQSSVTGLQSSATAGIMTSRAGSMAFFSDGTNRAMFRFTLMNHLCTDLEPLKDVTRTPDRVRRDVSRSPGGDSRIFLNGCVGCHAGMDGMAGAFAFYEWNYTNDKSDGSLSYTPVITTDPDDGNKHNINPNNFEYGYITTNDSWVNYWRNGPNSILGNRPGDAGIGWGHAGEVLDSKGNATGNGAKALGIELANSKAFAQCQVDKAFKAICLRDPNVFTADRTARDGFVSNFTGSIYDMREVFTDVAAYCKGS
jgi:hypothetical protein